MVRVLRGWEHQGNPPTSSHRSTEMWGEQKLCCVHLHPPHLTGHLMHGGSWEGPTESRGTGSQPQL